jgi:hypothetical protein
MNEYPIIRTMDKYNCSTFVFFIDVMIFSCYTECSYITHIYAEGLASASLPGHRKCPDYAGKRFLGFSEGCAMPYGYVHLDAY